MTRRPRKRRRTFKLHPRIAQLTPEQLMEVAVRVLADSDKVFTPDQIALILSAAEEVNDQIARANPHLTYREIADLIDELTGGADPDDG
jgi:hypothetical protein